MGELEKEAFVANDNDDYRIYGRDRGESPATGWFVGIIVALALLSIGYLVFSASSEPKAGTPVTQQ